MIFNTDYAAQTVITHQSFIHEYMILPPLWNNKNYQLSDFCRKPSSLQKLFKDRSTYETTLS